MGSLKEIKKAREEKLEKIKKAGINPYPAKCERTFSLSAALNNFDAFEKSQEEIILAGRIMAIREHGGSTFFHIKDQNASCQVYLKRDKIGKENYKFFKNFDIGDFIEVKGTFFKTKKGEKTLLASNFKMLVKTLRPLPEKWRGLKNIELRFRQRYLDLLTNERAQEIFIKRSKIIDSIRDFLTERDYIEVETPTLQEIAGGALAKPFRTHLEAYHQDYFLRIAPELYLKKILVGGLEKIFELAKVFRNEGFSTKHSPEYTLLEIYTAYFDYCDVMRLAEELLKYAAKRVLGGFSFDYLGKEINFGAEWKRITFKEILEKEAGINIDKFKEKDKLVLELKKRGLKLDFALSRGKILDKLFEAKIEEKLIQPTFITDIPKDISPLAKGCDNDKENTQRFELYIGKMEIANAYSELNDPQDQKERFTEQLEKKEKGDPETHLMDKSFIEALEYGMPPAGGVGFGIDRLIMLFTNSNSIRDVILFPSLKFKK